MSRYVDPPSGWKYGFPKIWDGEGSMDDWLVEEGYPRSEIEKMGKYFYVRCWAVDDFPPENDK
jgi:hypothetical protein